MALRAPVLLLVLLPVWLAASYGVRFSLMEDGHWVGLCAQSPEHWGCQLRAAMGLVIHWRLLAWAALLLALMAALLSGRWGGRLAAAALVLAIPAVVLYSASLGVIAVVLSGLRLVRR